MNNAPPISPQSNIAHIAELARIRLTEEEIAGFIKKQQMVLANINQLQDAAIGSEEKQSAATHTSRTRVDEATNLSGIEARDRMLGSSPLRNGDVIKIVRAL